MEVLWLECNNQWGHPLICNTNCTEVIPKTTFMGKTFTHLHISHHVSFKYMKNILNCSRTSRRWRKFLFRFASHELDDSSTRIRRIFKLSNTTRVVKILYIFFVLYLMALFSLLLCVVPGHIHYRLGKNSTHVECFLLLFSGAIPDTEPPFNQMWSFKY